MGEVLTQSPEQANSQSEKLKEIQEYLNTIDLGNIENDFLQALNNPEKREDATEIIKPSLSNLVQSIVNNKGNGETIPKGDKNALKLYHMLFIGGDLDENQLFNTVKNHLEANSQKGEKSQTPELKREDLISQTLEKLKKSKTPEEQKTILEELRGITFSKEEVKKLLGELNAIKSNNTLKTIIEDISDKLMVNLLRNGYKIDDLKDLKDLNFLISTGVDSIKSEKIKASLRGLKPSDRGKVIKLEGDDKKGYDIEIFDSNDAIIDQNTLNTASVGEIVEDIKENGITKERLQEMIKKLEGTKFGQFLKPILEIILIIFPDGLNTEKNELSKDKKIKALQKMIGETDSKSEFFKNLSFDVNGNIQDKDSKETQASLLKLQTLLGISETEGEGEAKKLVYSDKTKQAVKNIQKQVYGPDKEGKASRITGIFDKQTATDYLAFLEKGENAGKPEEELGEK